MKVASFNRSSIALAGALLFAAAAGPVFAQNTNPAAGGNVATAPSGSTQSASKDASQSAGGQAQQSTGQSAAPHQLSAHDREALKLSQEGLGAMRSVHAARIAIFDGDTKMAKQLLSTAESSLQAAAKDVTTLQGNAKKAGNNNVNASTSGPSTDSTQTADSKSAGTSGNKADYVPIDGQMTMADGFIATPASNGQDAKSGQSSAQAKDGAPKENLKLAAVDATFTRVMMPLETTTQHVDAAAKLIDQQKYYEANQALKAAEEGLMIDVIALEGRPMDGAPKGSDSSANSTSQSQAPAKPKS
ncbi:MAG: YfdX family protein [Burkholderiaceae bacterium]